MATGSSFHLLRFPQWHGSANPNHVAGGRAAAAVVKGRLRPAVTADVAVEEGMADDGNENAFRQYGVHHLDAILRQAGEARAVLERWCCRADVTTVPQTSGTQASQRQPQLPPCIFTAGGDCGVEVVPVSYAHFHWPSLVIVWFDAHADLNSPSTSPSGHFHGMPVRTLLGNGPTGLASLLFTPHDRPIRASQFVFVGTRDIDQPEQEYIDAHRMRLLNVSDADETSSDQSLPQRLTDALKGQYLAAYIHVDLDVLDPSVFPCTCCPTAGGLSLTTLLDCVRAVQDAVPRVVGCGLTECCGDPSSHSHQLSAVVDALVRAMERSPSRCGEESGLCVPCEDAAYAPPSKATEAVHPPLVPSEPVTEASLSTGALAAATSHVEKSYPDIIQRYWYAIDWDVHHLWSLELEVVQQPMRMLEWHLDVPVWPDQHGAPYMVTPRAVISEPTTHAREAARIAAADTTFPLEVYELRGRLMILDGIHRLAQLHAAGVADVHVRYVPETAVRHVTASHICQ